MFSRCSLATIPNVFFAFSIEVGVENLQLQIPKLRADKAWRISDGKREGCLLMETIIEPDKGALPRIILKNAAARISLGVRVITVLLYVQRGRYRTFPDSFVDRLGGIRKVRRKENCNSEQTAIEKVRMATRGAC